MDSYDLSENKTHIAIIVVAIIIIAFFAYIIYSIRKRATIGSTQYNQYNHVYLGNKYKSRGLNQAVRNADLPHDSINEDLYIKLSEIDTNCSESCSIVKNQV